MMLVTVISVPVSPTSPPASVCSTLPLIIADSYPTESVTATSTAVATLRFARKFTSVGSSPVFVGDEITTV